MACSNITMAAPFAPRPLPTLRLASSAQAARQTTALVEVVVPVYNEQGALPACIRRLHEHLSEGFPFAWQITIADNASTDETARVARVLADDLPEVEVLSLPEKGRGRALRAAWSTSEADVVAYMDVDLSTDLAALLPLVAPLVSGHSDVAIGSRLARGSQVVRGPKREFISRSYNHLLRLALGVGFSDAQCGFKAVRTDVAHELLPQIRDEAWFFDTELLVLAQRAGLRIHEVPVDWVDDPDSRVDIVSTAWEDLKGVWRLRGSRSAVAPVTFAMVLLGLWMAAFGGGPKLLVAAGAIFGLSLTAELLAGHQGVLARAGRDGASRLVTPSRRLGSLHRSDVPPLSS